MICVRLPPRPVAFAEPPLSDFVDCYLLKLMQPPLLSDGRNLLLCAGSEREREISTMKLLRSWTLTRFAQSEDPCLSNQEYDHILEVLQNMAHDMERSPAAFARMNEESLRTHFLVQLDRQKNGTGQSSSRTTSVGSEGLQGGRTALRRCSCVRRRILVGIRSAARSWHGFALSAPQRESFPRTAFRWWQRNPRRNLSHRQTLWATICSVSRLRSLSYSRVTL